MWYSSAQIHYAAIDEIVVVMDLRTGGYALLNEAAAKLWSGLLAPDGPSALDDAARSFLDRCLALGWVTAMPPAPPEPEFRHTPRRGAIVVRAWLSLCATAVALRWRGFTATYTRYARLGRAAAECPVVGLDRAAAAFLRAESLFFNPRAPDDCLARSLALFRFLRALGLPAQHHISGRRFPSFMMHAWVKCDGRVVLDDPGCADALTTIATLP